MVAPLAGLAVALACGGLALGADPVAFEQVSGRCEVGSSGRGERWWITERQAQTHEGVLLRGEFGGGRGWWNGGSVRGGDVDWAYEEELEVEPGGRIEGQIVCEQSNLSYAIGFYDAPRTPTSFAGKTSTGSEIAFEAGGDAEYAGSVTVTAGAVSINSSAPITGVAEVGLGELSAGDIGAISVEAAGAGSGKWSLSVYRGNGDDDDDEPDDPGFDDPDDPGFDDPDDPGFDDPDEDDGDAGEDEGEEECFSGDEDEDGICDDEDDEIGDRTAPRTEITDGPKGKTTDRSPTFKFKAKGEQKVTFECRLDGRDWKGCSSPHTTGKLDLGGHVFRVRASDAAGNRDRSPAERKFTVVKKQ